MNQRPDENESFERLVDAASRKDQPTRQHTNLVDEERQQLEIEELKTGLGSLKDQIRQSKEIHWARMCGLGLLFLLVIFWLVAILIFVYLAGSTSSDGSGTKALDLSDNVLLALIGSTTVNVVGLFYVAARWLYGDSSQ